MADKCLDLDPVRLENRAFRIYVNLLSQFSRELSAHLLDPEDLAARARDYVDAFYNEEVVTEPSDPNLLQFEGVETVFGEFRTNGNELWWVSHDGHQVLQVNFKEQFQAIDATQELNERFNGYPVKGKEVAS